MIKHHKTNKQKNLHHAMKQQLENMREERSKSLQDQNFSSQAQFGHISDILKPSWCFISMLS